MKPTGKNLEQFEKWLPRNFQVIADGINGDFHSLDFELRIGVYLAYYDSLEIHIEIQNNFFKRLSRLDNKIKRVQYQYSIQDKDSNHNGVWYERFDSRDEAYKEAFKKANKIVNETSN